jgi:hypothetical protein
MPEIKDNVVLAQKTHPGNIQQLLHMSVVAMIDLVHRYELGQVTEQSADQMNTICLLMYCAILVQLDALRAFTFLWVTYDDCGLLALALTNVIAKALFLPGVTVVLRQQFWCASISDDGSQDELRLVLVAMALLMRSLGYTFFDFPKKRFLMSVANSMHYLYDRPQGVCLFPYVRVRLIQASLLLMGLDGMSFRDLEISDADLLSIYRPVTEIKPRALYRDELGSFLLPLAIQYLLMDNRPGKVTVQFIENILHLADHFRKDINGQVICLLVLAELTGIPDIYPLLETPCPEYVSDWQVHDGTWASVFLEVAVRTVPTATTDAGLMALSAIASRVLPALPNVHTAVLTNLFRVLTEEMKFELQMKVIQAIHWMLNNSVPKYAKLAALVLSNAANFQKIFAEHSDFFELRQLLEWAQRQAARLNAVKKQFAEGEILKLLSDPQVLVETVEVPEQPPDVDFSLKDWLVLVNCALVSHFIADTTDFTFTLDIISQRPKVPAPAPE